MCDSCNEVNVNGSNVHEWGCPDAWMDEKIACKNCGCWFEPEEKNQCFCDYHCGNVYNNLPCDCEFCIDFDYYWGGEYEG